MKKHIYILLFLLLSTYTLFAQIDSTNIEVFVDEITNWVEDLGENEEFATEELLELMEEGQVKPNLNALSYESAVSLLHLSEYQYYQLQLYIENYGQLASIYELLAIDGFTDKDLHRLEQAVVVYRTEERQNFFKNFFKRSKQSLIIRYGQVLEHQAGYDTTRSHHYDGSPGHSCFKYSFSSQDKFFLKIAGEKDPGEAFFRGKQKHGFDFYAGSLAIKNVGIVKCAVLGDYRLNFGQGLVLGSSLLSGKGGGPDALRQFGTGIRPVAPTNEGSFLRGGAITLGKTKWSGSLFAGRQFGTCNNSFGLDLNYRHSVFKIGLRVVADSYTDTAGTTIGERLKSSFIPTGFTVAMDHQLIVKRVLLFGEYAVNGAGKVAILQALTTSLTPTFKVGAVFRHYGNGYQSALGSALGASSHNSGETGLYLTAHWVASRNCEVTLYHDYYRLTWLSYRTDAPVSNMDIGLSTTYNINRYSQLQFKYTFKTKSQNNSNAEYFKDMLDQQKHRVNIQWTNSPLAILKLKTGLSWQCNAIPTQQTRRQGILLYQDAVINIDHIGLAMHARIAYFDTDSYDERLYAYEDDVYYAFTIGSYYHQGIRAYLVLRYKYKWLSLWLRLSQTYYTDRQTISSGLNEIDKPHKTELKAQVMFSL